MSHHHGSGACVGPGFSRVGFFYAFDLLQRDGKDLKNLPIEKRRAALVELLEDVEDPIRISPILDAPGGHVLEAIRGLGLERVVGKRSGSKYEVGERSGAWIKHRTNRRQEFVIGGYVPGAHGFDALLVGVYESKELVYVAKVKDGFVRRVADLAPQIKEAAEGGLSVREPAGEESRALGGVDDGGEDERMPLGETVAGLRGGVHGVDGWQASAALHLCRDARRQAAGKGGEGDVRRTSSEVMGTTVGQNQIVPVSVPVHCSRKRYSPRNPASIRRRAGEGNRTLVCSLGIWCPVSVLSHINCHTFRMIVREVEVMNRSRRIV